MNPQYVRSDPRRQTSGSGSGLIAKSGFESRISFGRHSALVEFALSECSCFLCIIYNYIIAHRLICFSALDIFLLMRYINLRLLTYLLILIHQVEF